MRSDDGRPARPIEGVTRISSTFLSVIFTDGFLAASMRILPKFDSNWRPSARALERLIQERGRIAEAQDVEIGAGAPGLADLGGKHRLRRPAQGEA